MKIVISRNNIPIRITDERMTHILKNHPEMDGAEDNISETIGNPDKIFAGDFGEMLAVKFFSKTPVSENKYLTVAFKEINDVDGFIITAYFSRRINKRRKVLWKRSE